MTTVRSADFSDELLPLTCRLSTAFRKSASRNSLPMPIMPGGASADGTERNRSKVGRMARLTGKTAKVVTTDGKVLLST